MPILLPALSRRRFLAGAAAVATAASFPLLAAEDGVEIDPARIALLSDCHIDADPAALKNGAVMGANLEKVVAEVVALRPRPTLAVVCGDLAVLKGLPGDYATFVKLLEPLRKAGVPISLMLGNHDDRVAFWEALPRPDGGKRAVADRQVELIDTKHATLVLLDTLDKVNASPGKLGDDQLAWLGTTLGGEAAKPIVVFTHHHLQEKPVTILDGDAFWKLMALAKGVKAHIFGHTHTWEIAERDGIHKINLPPTSYVFGKGAPSGWVDLQLTAGGGSVELRSLDPTHAKHGKKTKLAWR